MSAPLLHYIAVDEIRKSVDPSLWLSSATVGFKVHPIDDLFRIAKAVHIFGGGEEPKKPATLATPGPTPKPEAKIITPGATTPKPSASLVTPSFPSSSRSRPAPVPEMGPGSHGFKPPVKAEHAAAPDFGGLEAAAKQAQSAGAKTKTSATGLVVPSHELETPNVSKPIISPAEARPKVISPSQALVDPSGKPVSAPKVRNLPSGFRGRVNLDEPRVITPSTTTSSARSAEELRAAPIQQKMEGFRAKQAEIQARAPKPAAPSATPGSAASAEAPAAEPAAAKEKKPSLLFRPEGEEGSDMSRFTPGGRKPPRPVNILGAFHLGGALAAGGAGSGARALGVLGGRAAMGAHRLLNARTSSVARREQYGRETALQTGPSQNQQPRYQ